MSTEPDNSSIHDVIAETVAQLKYATIRVRDMHCRDNADRHYVRQACSAMDGAINTLNNLRRTHTQFG